MARVHGSVLQRAGSRSRDALEPGCPDTGGGTTGGLTQLFRLLLGTAAAALAAAALTMLTLSAARAAERARSSRYGARSAPRGAAFWRPRLLEAGLVAAVVLVLGGAAGGIAAGLAAREWPGPMGPGGPTMIPLSLSLVSAVLVLAGILPLVFARRTRLTQAEAHPLPLLVPAIQLGISLTVLTAGALVARHASTMLHSATLERRDGDGVPGHRAERITGRAGVPSRSLASMTLERLPAPVISLSSPGSIAGLGTVAGITTDCGLCPIRHA